jgi:3-hydroxyacyl-[acyl-carrier-protein] dehydratase
MQLETLSSLITDLKRRPLHRAGPATCAVGYGEAVMQRLVPHTSPFLLLDEIEAVDLPARTICGRLRVRADDPALSGYLARAPAYPAVLQIEAMAQLGLCLVQLLRQGSVQVADDAVPALARVLRIHHATYVTPVKPGEDLELHAAVVEEEGMTVTVAGQILRDGVIVALAVQEFYLEK